MDTASSKGRMLTVDGLGKTRKRSSYIEILGNIAADLDIMLSDLCEVYPDPKHSSTVKNATQKCNFSGRKRALSSISDDVFLDYISCAGEDETVIGSQSDNSGNESDVSSSNISLLSEIEVGFNSTLTKAIMFDQLPSTPREIALIDRLVLTHPVWYQPVTSKLAAFHMLQGQQEGSFIVHHCIEADSMSLAVRVQTESQMTVQLFTIKNTTAGVKLLECDKCFTSVPKLIAHLCQHKECLPVPLLLPLPLLISKSIQELSALGLLGPDFWTSSMNRSATLPAIELLKVSPNKVYKSEAYVPLNDDDKQSVVQSTTIVQNVSVASPTLQPRSYTMPAVQLNNTTIPVSFTNPAYRTGSMSSPPAKSPPAKWVELSSQFDSDSNKRYPAPAGAPPPPPANQVPLYYQNPLHSSSSESSPRVERSSGDYYSPYEATKQNHLPPSSFGMYMNQLPPSMLGPSLLPPKRDGTAPVIPSPEDPYNVPSTGSQNPWVPSDQPSSSAFSASNRFMLSPGPSTTSNRLSALSGSSQLGGNSSVSSSNTSRNSFDSTGISTVLDNMSGSSNRTSFTSFGSDMSAVSASNDENRSDILDIRVPSCDASILKPVKSPVIQRPGETLKAFDPLNSASSLPVKKKQDWETFSDSNISVNSMNVAKCSAQDNLNWAFTGTDEKRSTVSSYTSSVFSTDSVFLPENEAGFSEFNVDDVNTPIPRGRSSAISRDSASLKPSVASSGTVFDDPWNSNLWEDLMNLGETKHQPSFTNSTDESSANEKSVQTNLTLERNSDTSATQTKRNTRGRTSKKNKTPFSPKNKDGGLMMSIFYLDDDHAALLEDDEKENEPDKSNRRKSLGLKEKFKPLLTPPSMVLKRRKQDPSRKIQAYIIKMSTNMNITFGHSVVNFIQCTKESTESNSATVMRNVRQFMNGIKHHLIQEDIGLQCVLNREKAKLGPDESLDNEDAIIEGALHKCVIKPLKAHIYQCLTREYSRNKSIQLLNENLKTAKTKTPEELGVRSVFIPPQGASMVVLQHFFNKMYKAYSPLSKMDCLLKAVNTIYKSTKDTRDGHEAVESMGADDFLPVFIYVLAHCDVKTAEIDADYMWGLLDPNLLIGQGGYYLTTLSSAVCVIKNMHLEEEDDTRLPCISDMQGFLKIAFHDNENDVIMSKTLPITPSMTTSDVCQLIASKLDVDNPDDFLLYLVADDTEQELGPRDCPQQLKSDLHTKRQPHIFGYRNKNVHVNWPTPM